MFRTEIHINDSPEKINHNQKVISLGSCFSKIIGKKLEENKFQVLQNPFGTLFNPVSIFRLFYTPLEEILREPHFTQIDEVWHNFYFHSQLSSPKKELVAQTIKEAFGNVRAFITQADWLIITLGTAIVYELKENGFLVANCHKVPGTFFSKRFLNIEEIKAAFQEFYQELKKCSPQARIILTVSPVRHLKEGFEENQVSKSILRIAAHELTQQSKDVFYFPSYEILLDDLRDYRYYADDLVHPSRKAEEYVWSKFSSSYFSPHTQEILKSWQKIRSAIQHKPFFPETKAYRNHLEAVLQKLGSFQKTFDIEPEVYQIKALLAKL